MQRKTTKFFEGPLQLHSLLESVELLGLRERGVSALLEARQNPALRPRQERLGTVVMPAGNAEFPVFRELQNRPLCAVAVAVMPCTLLSNVFEEGENGSAPHLRPVRR